MIAVIFRVSRAAVDAPEIAAVRDRNAQVGDLPSEFVEKSHATFLAGRDRLNSCPFPKNKIARSNYLDAGARRKYVVFRLVRSFPSSGGPGVSTQTLSFAASKTPPRRLRPCALGFLSRRPQGSEFPLSLCLCQKECNSVEPGRPNSSENSPYRFYFYSHEPNERRHVHVDGDEPSAKFWLIPVALAPKLWV